MCTQLSVPNTRADINVKEDSSFCSAALPLSKWPERPSGLLTLVLVGDVRPSKAGDPIPTKLWFMNIDDPLELLDTPRPPSNDVDSDAFWCCDSGVESWNICCKRDNHSHAPEKNAASVTTRFVTSGLHNFTTVIRLAR